MKLVHAADVHLDSPLHGLERYEGAPVEELRGATRRAFANLVDLCLEEAAAVLVLAGDLYDGDWRDFSTGLFFAAQMSRLRERGVRVFVALGNHDAASRITRDLRLPDNVHVFATAAPETVRLDDLGVAVHGQSFSQRDVTEDLSLAYPAPIAGLLNVGVLHTCADGRAGHDRYAPCRVEALVAKGYDYWALGHVHLREILHQDPWVVFPGNLQGRHARELGPKGCTLVTVDDGVITQVEARAVDVVRWSELLLDAADCDTGAALLDRLAAELPNLQRAADGRACALRLRVSGRTAAAGELLRRRDAWIADARALATDGSAGSVWLEKVVLDVLPPIDRDAWRAQAGPIAELLQDMAELRQDEERLAQYVALFDDVRAKLPVELRSGDGGLDLGPEGIRGALDSAELLLLERLLDRETER